MANEIVNDKQHTLKWHVDDAKASHADPKVNDKFVKWCKKKHGTFGSVAVKRGKLHEYLGMKLDCTKKGKLIVHMTDGNAEEFDSNKVP